MPLDQGHRGRAATGHPVIRGDWNAARTRAPAHPTEGGGRAASNQLVCSLRQRRRFAGPTAVTRRGVGPGPYQVARMSSRVPVRVTSYVRISKRERCLRSPNGHRRRLPSGRTINVDH